MKKNKRVDTSVESKSIAVSTDFQEHLPVWEIVLSFCVWIGHALWSWYAAYRASTDNESLLYGAFFEPGWQIFGQKRHDVADFEWKVYMARLKITVACFCLRYLIRQFLMAIFGQKATTDHNNLAMNFTFLSIDCVLSCFIYGTKTFLITTIHGFAIYLIGARFSRKLIVIWLVAIFFLYTLSTKLYHTDLHTVEFYNLAIVVAYKLLQYISFCSDIIENERKKDKPICVDLFAMFCYTNYLPYSIALIVPYENFTKQMLDQSGRLERMNDYKKFFILAIRITFWIFVVECVLHFVYVHAIMIDANIMRRLDLATMCAMGYVSGQFFYMKYVCIFGVNALFAFMDGMQPPWPPICIARVSLYSKMWRYFDRGLYAFLKVHIFMPIVKPSFSLTRRILGAAMCFGFIWLWHGANWHLFVWSALNFVEIVVEFSGKALALQMRHAFSPVWRQRFGAVYGILCVTLGLCGIFYFLGGDETGFVFLDRVLLNNLPFSFSIGYLVILGYFYNNCCAVIDRYYCINNLY